MFIINIGYECGDGTHCDKYKQCKYRARWHKLHNLKVNIHRFFEYKLHIKLPYLISIGQNWVRLSGTDKCPFHKSRNYTCYDCAYNMSFDEACSCKERVETPYDKRLPDVPVDGWDDMCPYFNKCDWADNYTQKMKECQPVQIISWR